MSSVYSGFLFLRIPIRDVLPSFLEACIFLHWTWPLFFKESSKYTRHMGHGQTDLLALTHQSQVKILTT